ncbi:MAG TPA: hypothetical protein VHB69_00650 [Mycobacteriales bacterium]|nr:hypothetical protein [Mycobacteriales bacterium]
MRRRLLAVLAIGVAGIAASAPAAAAAAGTPYRDPDAAGSIGLCDRAGHQITHGSVSAAPFAWRAVSTVAAPTGYGVSGGTATLMAYQPRQGLDSGEWSGDELTSASRYSNPAHPTAAATSGDESLEGFMTEFKPAWDGLLELRLYLGAPDQPIYSQSYPALNIRVTGNTWHTVGGPTVSCASGGTSVSLESILLSPHPASSGSTSAPGSAPDARSAPPASSTPAAEAASSSSTTAAGVTTSSGSGHLPVIVAAVVSAVVLLLGGYGARRRLVTIRPSKKGPRP